MTEQQLAVMRQALEALKYLSKPMSTGWSAEAQLIKRDAAITVLRQALESGTDVKQQSADELRRLQHNNQVLMDALWKACGDDEEVVNATIESQGTLK